MAAWFSISFFLLGVITTSDCQIPENHCLNSSYKYVKANPQCTYGCEEGWSGSFCQVICWEKCRACKSSDPYNCTRCRDGNYGDKCEQRCYMCVDDDCYPNGTCVRGRIQTTTVYNVDNAACSTGCKNGSCDQITGHCNGGCTSTVYGNTCNNTCPTKCKKCHGSDCRTCDEKNGKCLSGCEEGFSGALCEDIRGNNGSSPCEVDCPVNCLQCHQCGICAQCETGWYGTDCNTSCSGCQGRLCGFDGKCVSGCVEGHTGEMCNRLLYSGAKQGDIWGTILDLIQNNELFLPLFGCSLALVMVVIAIIIWRCRRKKTARNTRREDSQTCFIRQEKTEHPEFGKCGDMYHEIADEDLDPDPVGVTNKRLISERPPQPIPQNSVNIHTATQQLRAVPGPAYMTPVADINIGDGPQRVVTSRCIDTPRLAIPGECKFRTKMGMTGVAGNVRDKPGCSGMQRGTTGYSEREQCGKSVRDQNNSALDDQGYLTPNKTTYDQASDFEVKGQQRVLNSDQCPGYPLIGDQRVETMAVTGQDFTQKDSRSPPITPARSIRLSCEF